MNAQLTLFSTDSPTTLKQNVVNVASVPQRSPFRYPGGKTWLIPKIRQWLSHSKNVKELIEPFAGGGIVSLTAAFEKLADHVTMVELDDDVAAVWETILSDNNRWLADKIYSFDLTLENINTELNAKNKQRKNVAFCTILRNRISHGGIIAKGSGIIKNGENGKGLGSRWYAKTLRDRILAIEYIKNDVTFLNGDAFAIIETNMKNRNAVFFVDPPYTIAGKRLYSHYNIDHERLFALVAGIKGHYMMTYDDTTEIRALAEKYNLPYKTIPMKTTHHLEKNEIIISDSFNWW